MRLVDADALYNRFLERAWYDNADRDECACVDVDNAPTVDAIAVVRCKDCEYYDECTNFLFDDDYCSRGERK